MKVSTQFEWQQRLRLLDERDRLGRIVTDLRAAAISRAGYEPYDIIDDEAALQADAIEQRLAGVENALHRLDSGSYGQCRLCGEPIGAARLEALPAAEKCVKCAG